MSARDEPAPGCVGVGIGLRAPHVAGIIAQRPVLAFLEVHAENYMHGGPALGSLERLRRDYPVSLHAVGLSLGGADALDARHLARLHRLVQQLDPQLVSEHLAWSVADGAYFNHLLPLPYDAISLNAMCARVARVQDVLARRILVENPSRYLRFRYSPIPEPEFLGELTRRTGCGILLDVNNVYVSCRNFEEDACAYLDALPKGAIAEIHLAGHATNSVDGHTILIDDHGSRVAEPVWRLYARAIELFGPIPTLVEWDANLPELGLLLEEAATAQRWLDATLQARAAAVAA
jgi:uncharacterized protein (UPF0276 family)